MTRHLHRTRLFSLPQKCARNAVLLWLLRIKIDCQQWWQPSNLISPHYQCRKIGGTFLRSLGCASAVWWFLLMPIAYQWEQAEWESATGTIASCLSSITHILIPKFKHSTLIKTEKLVGLSAVIGIKPACLVKSLGIMLSGYALNILFQSLYPPLSFSSKYFGITYKVLKMIV